MLRLEAMLVSNKERNYPNLKNTIDSDFDKVKNYNSIHVKNYNLIYVKNYR